MTDLSRREFAALAAAAAASPFIGSAAAVQIRPAINPPDDRFFRQTLPRLMDATGAPGLAAGIVQNGTLVWETYEGLGEAGTTRAIAAETLFPAASLGKPVFAYAALRLAEQGQLDLDRPLKSYVPDHAPADARGDKVTARHVLSHTSGFRNWRNAADEPLVPEFDPGSRFQYSGEGFYYLSRAVEKITGRAVQRFMEESLFLPFGMPSSSYAWRDDTETRLVLGHNRGALARPPSREFSNRLFAHAKSLGRPLASFTHEELVAAMTAMKPAPRPLPNFIPTNVAGSLMTTVGDYGRFLARLLSPRGAAHEVTLKMRAQMLAPRVRLNRALAWGLGWGLETAGGRDYIWHWGDNGTIKNFVLAHVPSHSAVVVFTNDARGMRIAEAIVKAASGHDHVAFDWLG
ncbi:MAG TPA: serine hydrolase domain-containing protein [Vicinamibacterales bacterium]|nr:serine hydrolase domain-containing protein [Vicinamibacterales bacterium]